MRRTRHIAWIIVALAILAAPVAVQAASSDWRQAIRDCATDGRLHQQYTQTALLQALRHLPPDINEYTDCYDVLRSALAHLGGSSGGPGSSSITPTASDLNGLSGIAHGARPRLSIGGHNVSPGVGGTFSLASRTASNALPAPLLWMLIALAAACALAGAVALRNRLPGMRRVALRILRR